MSPEEPCWGGGPAPASAGQHGQGHTGVQRGTIMQLWSSTEAKFGLCGEGRFTGA